MDANAATNMDQNLILLALSGMVVLGVITLIGMIFGGVFDEMAETTKAMEARLLRVQAEQSEIHKAFYGSDEEVETEFEVLIRKFKNASAKPEIPSIYTSRPSRYVARKIA